MRSSGQKKQEEIAYSCQKEGGSLPSLVYYNYRHYNPKQGRWLRRDIVQNNNEHAIANNNCIRIYDYVGAMDPIYGGYLHGCGLARKKRRVSAK
ncbi:MAG: hypothetical protein IKA09_07320 [Lachnospiraceae bacterium]|nr:hypothetical protein [Lachnospiraceae bacterium]